MTPCDFALENQRDLVLDCLATATNNVACAMIECILHPKSTAPSTAIQHIRDTVMTDLPNGHETIHSLSDRRVLQSLGPLMNQEFRKTLRGRTSSNNHLRSGENEQDYFENHPFDKLGGGRVMHSVSDASVECLFLHPHLQDNPFLL
jgi:hypothetical protein